MNDEMQVRELLALAGELPDEVRPPVTSLLQRGRRQRTRRTGVVAVTAAVAVLAGVGLPAIIHGPRPAPYRPGRPGAFAGLFGGLPSGSPAGPAAARSAGIRWSGLPASPLGPQSRPVLAWTGRELIELGGARNGSTISSGAAFSPATGRWHLIAGVGHGGIGLADAVSVWTGRQLFVAGGTRAALYDPAAGRWTPTRLPAAMGGLNLNDAAWTGRDVIVAGTSSSRGRLGVAAYDPATGRWRMITPLLPSGHPVRFFVMTATASRIILWSMWDVVHGNSSGFSDVSGVDVLALGADGTWRDVTGRWPQHATVNDALFTGTEILIPPGVIWCGTRCSSTVAGTPAYFADPVTLARTGISAPPLGESDAFIWTGRAIIALDQGVNITSLGGRTEARPDDMALWDPGTGRWRRLPAPHGYPRLAATPQWVGRELLTLTARGQLLVLRG